MDNTINNLYVTEYIDALGNKIYVKSELKDDLRQEMIYREKLKGRGIIEENKYFNGIKESQILYEYEQFVESIEYKQGVKDGAHKQYINGKINIEENYSKGALDGKTTYFNNEIGKKEVFYKDGYIIKEIQTFLDEDSETLKVEKHYNNNLLEKEIITKVDLNLTSKAIKHFSKYKIHIEKQYENGRLVKYDYHSDYNKSGKVFSYEEGKLISKEIYGSNFYLKEFPFLRAPFTYFKLYFTKKIKLYLSKNYEECFTCDENGMVFNPLAESGISKCVCNGYKIFNKKKKIDWFVKIHSKLPFKYTHRFHEKHQSTWSFITKY
jgi:antitoxin component YwqK of YwqJK toxin-antitoxin module